MFNQGHTALLSSRPSTLALELNMVSFSRTILPSEKAAGPCSKGSANYRGPGRADQLFDDHLFTGTCTGWLNAALYNQSLVHLAMASGLLLRESQIDGVTTLLALCS